MNRAHPSLFRGPVISYPSQRALLQRSSRPMSRRVWLRPGAAQQAAAPQKRRSPHPVRRDKGPILQDEFPESPNHLAPVQNQFLFQFCSKIKIQACRSLPRFFGSSSNLIVQIDSVANLCRCVPVSKVSSIGFGTPKQTSLPVQDLPVGRETR